MANLCAMLRGVHVRTTRALITSKKDDNGKPGATGFGVRSIIIIGAAVLFALAVGRWRGIGERNVTDVAINFDPTSLSPSTQQRERIFSKWKETHGRRDKRTLVLVGEATLVDIVVPSDAFSGSNYNVKGVFCHVDFYLHKKDPSTVPMFRDLVSKSMHCKNGKFELDLYSIVKDARVHDAAAQTTGETSDVHTVPPTGFIFHESRVGSTLASNVMMAFDPNKNRVYSESGPPITAAKAAVTNEKQGIELLRDVVFLMGRSNVPEERRLFFKIQSIGTKSISVFRKAFEDIPFIFVFREPLEVMMSHIKRKGQSKANCLRQRKMPPNDLKAMVRQHGEDIRRLSDEDFCAAHLATLCHSALEEYKTSPGLRMVNYEDLPEILVDDIIPHHFVKEGRLDTEARERIESVSKKYSKGRFQGKKWEEDSDLKQARAWGEIRSASDKYLRPIYEELKKLASEGGRRI